MISYRQVKLAETQTVVESFLTEQWEHTGDKRLFCKPNWPAYHALEQAGSMVLLSAYDDNRPVGYLAAFVHAHMNAVDNLVATIPTYYVEQRPERALFMRGLFVQALALLKNRGVVQIVADTEWQHSAGRLLAALGFRPVKIGYKLELTERADA